MNAIGIVSTTTLGSSLGTGGMETKLIAAEIATAAGVSTVIASSKDPQNILRIIQYNNALKSGTSTPLDSTPSSGRSSPAPIPHINSGVSTPSSLSSLSSSGQSDSTMLGEGSKVGTPTRPPHTLFKPSPTPLRDLKSWTGHTLFPSGSVIIDAGAHQVLSKRESGGRLLPAGVLGVKGAFASGQAVKILVRKGSYGSSAIERKDSDEWEAHVVIGGVTQPNTPDLSASGSLSSSISTLDGMLGESLVSLGTIPEDSDITPSVTMKALPEENHVVVPKSDVQTEEWELEEVGRGLANYNSAQIERVKGLKRYDCYLLCLRLLG